MVDSRHLTVSRPPGGTFNLEIVTEIYPQLNTSLEVYTDLVLEGT
jgi:aminopeptidase N